MTRSARVLLVLCALLTLVPATALAVLHVGDAAPNFTLPDTAYANHSLTDYRGKVVQILFWQST